MAKRRERRERQGYFAETFGAVLLIAGLLLLAWELMTSGGLTTIPFNDYTYAALGMAAIGAAGFAIGADRGYSRSA
jgi:hypothetical protein